MYSKLVFLCLVVAGVKAAPAATDVVPLEKQQPTVIPIVSQSDELESNGTYKYSYETGNGIKREESSYTKVLPKVEGRSADSNEGGESEESNEIHVQEGSYSYTAPDGTLISVRYIADENGFRPVGDHIPQSVVAAAAAGGSSSEKSGRALNVADSADSASEPKPATAPAPKSAAAPAPAPEPKEKSNAAPESAPAESSEATTEAAKPTEGEVSTETASEAAPSTTGAPTTANASSEATEASEGTTTVEVTTKATDATTVAASEEPASTSAEVSTTEAATTAAA